MVKNLVWIFVVRKKLRKIYAMVQKKSGKCFYEAAEVLFD